MSLPDKKAPLGPAGGGGGFFLFCQGGAAGRMSLRDKKARFARPCEAGFFCSYASAGGFSAALARMVSMTLRQRAALYTTGTG